MKITLYRFALLSAAASLVVAVGTRLPASAEEGTMCPPITAADLVPDETPTTTTTTTAPVTTTTSPTTTTTLPTTTTTLPTTTTTTSPATTATSPATTTSTTSPATTTTTSPATTTTTLPTTTTTLPTTTTTLPSTSTTSPATTTTLPTTTVPPEPECDTPFVYPMVFPMLGGGDNISPFGAPRDGGSRLHMGNDLAAAKMQPVVAVADGVVTRVGVDQGISGTIVIVAHDDGWSSLYIHLNNDTHETDDGSGRGFSVEEGDRVSAGQVIGWNGDSGNAEGTVPHVHFELRNPDGEPVDPEASLDAAPMATADRFEGAFSDTEPDRDPFSLLLSRGVAVWCDDTLYEACPDRLATPGEVQGWLDAIDVDLATAGDDVVTAADLSRSIAHHLLQGAHDNELDRLRTTFPMEQWTSRLPAPPPESQDLTTEEAWRALAGHLRCLDRPDHTEALTREEAVSLLLLYRGWSEVPDCLTNDSNR